MPAKSQSHCFELLLAKKLPGDPPPVIFLFGDDTFLRRETASWILQLSELDPENVRSFDGEESAWLDVHDELSTLSLFADDTRRIAVVTAGDKFVKTWRSQLEKWCASPAASSLLVIQTDSFPANTKLYKLAAKQGWCIACGWPTSGRSKNPDIAKVKKWISFWGASRHGLHLTDTQVHLLLDAVGLESGLLHQELAKLSLFSDEAGKLSDALIREHVGSWRNRTIWEIADAVVDGRIPEALVDLQRVFASGEPPAAVVPQLSWSLRRYGMAAQLLLQANRHNNRMPSQSAINQCGFWGQDARLAEGRLKRLGLERAAKLLDWLLELDLKIKGSHSQPSRAVFALEELCLRLSD